MSAEYEPLNKEDQKLFQKHSKSIDKCVREVFPSLPDDFVLKPAYIRKQTGLGILYSLKVVLPDGRFANVSFNVGGLQPFSLTGKEIEPEPYFQVEPMPSSSKDK